MQRKTVILAGGGHTHALLLRNLQKHPLPCDVVLVSGRRFTPYSGMLPGVIAGRFKPEEAHIDLKELAKLSHCTFMEDDIASLNAGQNQLTTVRGHTLTYDLLSLNTGSTQSRIIDGPNCLTIKPIHVFLSWLIHVLPHRLEDCQKGAKPFHLVIIGAGAAGVETAFALRQRFKDCSVLRLHLITEQELLPGYNRSVQQKVAAELVRKNIQLHTQFPVRSINEHNVFSSSNQSVGYDQIILATSASPAAWTSVSGLSLDSQGFIYVNDCLQSCRHKNVFACGDIAAFQSQPLAKSGVYAVRQAPILQKNLRAALLGLPLVPYEPQKQHLSLLNCSDGRAIASRGAFHASGTLISRWKESIDKRFMSQFPSPKPGSMQW